MAYNHKSDINKILGLKNDWDKANKAGNTAEANRIAGNAQKYYDNLRKNSYGQIADNLNSRGAADAQKYVQDYLGTTGRQAIRPYFYGKGKQYGLSQSDIDNKFSYDERTGEVSFDGINLGKPAYETGGTSYWDSSALDKAWENVANKNGYTKSDDVLYSQGINATQDMIKKNWGMNADNEKLLQNKYGKLEDFAYNTNPYDTEIGKSIMQDFLWKGGKASDNAAADVAAGNGGNIDSYAAANAARQQLAFTVAGKQAVLEDHNARIGNIRGILSDLGLQMQAGAKARQGDVEQLTQSNQQIFDNSETRKNNEQARKNSEMERLALMSDITGYVPKDISISENEFFRDGKLINNGEGIDFQAMINDQEAIINNPNSSQEQIRQATKILNDLLTARWMKVHTNPNYAEYKDEVKAPGRDLTASTYSNLADERLENKKLDSAERVSMGELENQRHETDTKNELEKNSLEAQKAENEAQRQHEKELTKMQMQYELQNAEPAKPRITAEQAKQEYDSGNLSNEIIKAYTYYYGVSDDLAERIANQINSDYGMVLGVTNDPGNYKVLKPDYVTKIISAVSDIDYLDEEQTIDVLEKLGISKDDIDKYRNAPYGY